MARRHCEETPWHPRQFNPEISDEFVDLIADLMEKDPQRRIQTAAEVVQRLVPWVQPHTELPHPTQSRSRWNAPPVPTANRDETVEDFAELSGATTPPSPVEINTATSAVRPSRPTVLDSSATTPPGLAQLTISPHTIATRRAVVRALSIAVPVAMAAGGLLTYLFLQILR